METKNSSFARGNTVSHLTYIGDSDVGKYCNFGCGTVTCNYDGKDKFRTTIGDYCFIGCNTNLVAPVKVGDGAYTAAGSTITKDVPAQALGIARDRQTNLEGWAAPRWKPTSPKRRSWRMSRASKPLLTFIGLRRTPPGTALPCQPPRRGGQNLPPRGRWHRAGDDGRSSPQPFLRTVQLFDSKCISFYAHVCYTKNLLSEQK